MPGNKDMCGNAKTLLELESLVAGVCATKNGDWRIFLPSSLQLPEVRKKNITLSKKEKKSPLHRLLYK